jgi:SAM-dependent methyltransferase
VTRRNGTLPPGYFDGLYAASADPWRFTTSAYEQAKYEATLGVLDQARFARGFEIGCSIGVLTQRLAARCGSLLAVDVAEAALSAARRRCSDCRSVDIRRMEVPRELPGGGFDLVLLSEVGYYWAWNDLDRFVDWLRQEIEPAGSVLLVHWTGPTDYPLTADEVHEHIIVRTRGVLEVARKRREPGYRLELLRRPPAAK